jgi:hypothetical protein
MIHGKAPVPGRVSLCLPSTLMSCPFRLMLAAIPLVVRNVHCSRLAQRRWNVGKIESLHGTTPAEIFQSGLENLAEIEAIAISVMWKDGSVTSGWSNVDPARLALMILALDEEQRDKHLRDEME